MANFDWHAERSDLSGIALLDRAPESEGIDLREVRLYRLGRVREQMVRYGVDLVILSDPINIRYATGTRNMQVFSQRNSPSRYLVLTASRSILFEFTGCLHLADGYETVDEVRPASTASFVAAGPHIAERERAWAAEMSDLIVELVGKDATVGLERLNAGTALALAQYGFRIVDAQQPVEMARAIKSAEELKCVNASLRATEIGVGKLRGAVRPGITENELWSVLHKSIIEQNGDYCETRLLSAGQRTNPWFQETATYLIGENELVALDNRRRRLPRLLFGLFPDVPFGARPAERLSARALQGRARAGSLQYGDTQARHELPRLRGPSLGHTREILRQSILPVGAWLRHDGRVSLSLPSRGFSGCRL
jgi:Xaa-Pro dipeptidase